MSVSEAGASLRVAFSIYDAFVPSKQRSGHLIRRGGRAFILLRIIRLEGGGVCSSLLLSRKFGDSRRFFDTCGDIMIYVLACRMRPGHASAEKSHAGMATLPNPIQSKQDSPYTTLLEVSQA